MSEESEVNVIESWCRLKKKPPGNVKMDGFIDSIFLSHLLDEKVSFALWLNRVFFFIGRRQFLLCQKNFVYDVMEFTVNDIRRML